MYSSPLSRRHFPRALIRKIIFILSLAFFWGSITDCFAENSDVLSPPLTIRSSQEKSNIVAEKNSTHPIQSFEFRQGVIIDANRSKAYLMGVKGGIDALDLLSGKLLWNTKRAAKPLFLYGRFLLAQVEAGNRKGVLPLVVFDTHSPDKIHFKADLKLPNDVQALIDKGMETSFHTQVRQYKEGMVLSWEYTKIKISGIAPKDNQIPVERKARGWGLIDFNNRKLTPLNHEPQMLVEAYPLPEKIAQAIESENLKGTILRAGNVVAQVERIREGPEQKIILRRWKENGNDPLPTLKLFGEKFLFRYPSADQRHLLGTRREESAGEFKTRYSWRIYATATGRLKAEIPSLFLSGWFFVKEPLIIHSAPATSRTEDGKRVDQPPRLMAVNIKTGERVWQWPIRSTAYQGTLPPNTTMDSPAIP